MSKTYHEQNRIAAETLSPVQECVRAYTRAFHAWRVNVCLAAVYVSAMATKLKQLRGRSDMPPAACLAARQQVGGVQVMRYDLLLSAELTLLYIVSCHDGCPWAASSCPRGLQVLKAVKHLDVVDFVTHL